ncbi:hypothetical protein tinsulaeT_17780 [Thalassotalea insulae]|uniref:Lipocalin-like domain-containing protein n=1 Tax=Thalassotalea insulae TaxID=2056778 RepID=A0ABQ6GR55_9GAMM|nr:hypothetical protein [Thalassotalea insulae]GLX78438.1 hypothetical protein tinsulaeT_17780 [Thalassotalea insulae]
MKNTFLTLCCLLLTVSSQAAINNCSDKNYRAFDFWLGQWQVTTTKDNIVRTSKISQINDGCTILEEYSTPSGYTGKSFNIYDKNSGKWHQTWTDNSGLLLILTGNRVANQMILSGSLEQNGETVMQRIIWTANKDGSVRQHWQTKKPNEDNWQDAFDGLYRKK